MKWIKTVAAAALLAGLSTAATAGMGMGKCGGGMMQGDFATQKQMMLNNMAQMRKCVEAANTKADLRECRMKMMQKRKMMMQKKAPAAGKCGAGKCGGGK